MQQALTKFSDAVYFNTSEEFFLSSELIQFLKNKASKGGLQTIRACLHTDTYDLLHQMIILHHKDTYVMPHKHPKKTVSYHLIEGELLLFIFDDFGRVLHQVRLSEFGKGDCFGFRVQSNRYYYVFPLTEWVAFHEIMNGPFTGEGDSIFPEWAPQKSDQQGIEAFNRKLGI